MEAIFRTDKGKLMPINEDMAGWVTIRLGNDIEPCQADVVFVADGVGGSNKGDVASRMAVQSLVFLISNAVSRFSSSLVEDIEKSVPRFIRNIHSHIRKKAAKSEELKGMGTTLTAAIIIKDKMIIIHVGDSRLYRIEDNYFQQVTRDHSFVQELLDKGEITQDEAFDHPKKNKINRALGGSKPSVVPDVYVLDWNSGMLMLCTDGLTDMLRPKEIQDIVEANRDPKALCDKLVEAALEKGGHDNVSVVVARR